MVPPIPCHTIGTSTRIARDANSKVFKLSPTYTKLPCDLPFFLGKFWPWRVQATKLEAPVAKKLRLIFPFTVARSLNCIPWKCFSKQFSKHWLSIAEAKLNLQGQQHARRLDSRRLAVPCDNFHQWNHPRSSQDQASKQCEAWKHVGVLVLVIVNPAVNLSQGCIQWTCTLEMRIYTKDGNLPLLVSLLSRKGTCDLRAAKALTTFLRPTKSSTAMFQWLYWSVDPSMKDVKDWEVSPSGASTMGSVRVSPFSNPSICSHVSSCAYHLCLDQLWRNHLDEHPKGQ